MLWFLSFVNPNLSYAAQPKADELKALEQCPIVDRDGIYYGNGVGNSLIDATLGMEEIIRVFPLGLKKVFPDDRFKFCIAYNYSRGIELDIVEVLIQKGAETGLNASQLLDAVKLEKDKAIKVINIVNLLKSITIIIKSNKSGSNRRP